MSSAFRIAWIGLVVGASLSWWGAALGSRGAQDEPGRPRSKAVQPAAAASETLESIHADYNRKLLELERQRLERLAQLAARQAPRDAAETYETLFRLAIANNLFSDAETPAEQVLKSASSPSPVVLFLAQTINIIAEADRGAYDESLASLRRAIADQAQRNPPAAAPTALLDTPSLLALCGAYYQRLLQGNRFDIARKAFQLVTEDTSNPAVKEFCAARLNRLNMVGQPAPPINGTDIDGKPVSLSNLQGNVVLVVFWASWCMPNSAEITWLDHVYEAYRRRGFHILGMNLDVVQNGGMKLEVVMPNIRRFLVDHNVRWPNLVNGTGPNDYAKAYGVTEIPANFLIGRDGTIVHLDLSRKNLERAVARAVAQR
jgi:peroxiredoxin